MDKESRNKEQIVGILGVGLDNDEHKRLTRNDEVLLVGGSAETHQRMQEISIRFNESLTERGKRLHEAEVTEVVELWHDAADK